LAFIYIFSIKIGSLGLIVVHISQLKVVKIPTKYKFNEDVVSTLTSRMTQEYPQTQEEEDKNRPRKYERVSITSNGQKRDTVRTVTSRRTINNVRNPVQKNQLDSM